MSSAHCGTHNGSQQDERGVVDPKPENILLDTAGTPKLADFGIAKLAGEGAAKTRPSAP